MIASPFILGTVIGAFALNKLLKDLEGSPVEMARAPTEPAPQRMLPVEPTVIPDEPLPSIVVPSESPQKVIKPTVTQRSVAKVAKPKTATTTTKQPVRVSPISKYASALRNVSKPKTKSSSKTTTKSPVKTAPTTVKKIQPTVIKRSTAKVAKPRTNYSSSQISAAKNLDSYLRRGGQSRNTVKTYQKAMGGLSVDGIPGPLTYARAKKIYSAAGKSPWPMQKASVELHTYYNLGGRDKNKIKGYQKAMGELDVDGIVGPKTKNRYKTLTGKSW